MKAGDCAFKATILFGSALHGKEKGTRRHHHKFTKAL